MCIGAAFNCGFLAAMAARDATSSPDQKVILSVGIILCEMLQQQLVGCGLLEQPTRRRPGKDDDRVVVESITVHTLHPHTHTPFEKLQMA